jgi:hypothetical protein
MGLAVSIEGESRRVRVVGVATQGRGGNEEDRLRMLLSRFDAEIVPLDRGAKRESFQRVLRTIRDLQPDLAIVEGTGWAGGLAMMEGRRRYSVPYVVSSGDAVGPFIAARNRLAGPLFAAYERRLCRNAAGFIGWTPYLAGRALTFGTPRAMTAAGWAPFPPPADPAAARATVRARLGIASDALVVGIAGALVWNCRAGFCYGADLVRAIVRVERTDLPVVAVIIGDGDGRPHLEQLAGDRLGRSVILTGRVPQAGLPEYYAAFDIGSLPQSVDSVGSFRYTTKISEYVAAGLPILTGQIPMAYDLDDGGGWLIRLPGPNPWHPRYLDALAELLTRMTPAEAAARRLAVPAALPEFDRDRQIARVEAFLNELVAEHEAQRREKAC